MTTTTITTTSTFFLSSPPLPLPLPRFSTSSQPLLPLPTRSFPFTLKSISNTSLIAQPPSRSKNNPFLTRADDGDGDGEGAGPDDYEMDEDELEEVDNKKDFDIEYEPLTAAAAASAAGGDEDIAMVPSNSFVSTQGWDSETVVDYRINEEEFHKISLLDCDFFIRKPPDPDNDVYDFREMYVTPPDTDVYSIPKILAPMPQKYIRCAQSDYGCYNVTEPPIDAPRDPLYKTEREIQKAYLTKHYKNRRLGDPEFVLDFEEIYVIDSKTKSITRAKVLVTAGAGGRKRDRKSDLLVISDNGNSFKIIHASEQDDPTTIIEREEWKTTRQDMERHLRKLRDFSISNWF
ncbi:PLASTID TRANSCRIPTIONALLY ACTIVE protein 6, chloroplastic [Gastrolobium bilobum]|uniref:PLASTID TRANSCRIPTIONALLY ACTIVE protein 6, chloroplastic n=1 Tax=Gastrolobium bilobum TaxID=150636 RepID=UPI002AB2D733|nr:PLASTID TRANSCRIPTIONALLY ACTIVE protein 6, chloroplastic [Gastrolobium bilobum]